MALQHAPDHVPQNPEEVGAVCYLDRPRCASLRSLGIFATMVPAHDLGSWMLGQPGGDGVSGAVGQEIDHSVSLEIYKDRSIGPPLGRQSRRWRAPGALDQVLLVRSESGGAASAG